MLGLDLNAAGFPPRLKDTELLVLHQELAVLWRKDPSPVATFAARRVALPGIFARREACPLERITS